MNKSNEKRNIKRSNLIEFFAALLIIIFVNLIGHYLFARLDLTAEHRYTLSKSTKELLKGVDESVLFRVYLEGDEMPSLSMLVGFEIVNAANKETVGRVAAIDDSTANILFELEDGTLIPASDDLIEEIDAEQQQIKMNIPQGLLALR